jgi:DNA-3-methyladenine glycosylase II
MRVVGCIARLLLCRPQRNKRGAMDRITGIDHIELGLDALCAADGRLSAVRARAGDVPLRLSSPGFASLASIIVSQQVSKASAEAIFGRLSSLVAPLTAEAVIAAEDRVFRQAGLSTPKQRTLVAVAEAVAGGDVDLDRLCVVDAADAMATMTAIRGIGPWTAEVYLLFAAGHPDIFPARDVALQAAIGHAFGIDPRPGEKEVARIAQSWRPWRGVAARLFWAYYREMRGRDAAPVSP